MSNPSQGTSVPSVFSFESKQLRAISINGEPWFVAADVCAILELGNPTKAVLALDDDEKALTSIQGLSRGNHQANIINDSGLYTLILRCRDAVKPGSLPHHFRKKVTAEILPALRKTGQNQAIPVHPLSDEALTNLQQSNPNGPWRLTSSEEGRAYLRHEQELPIEIHQVIRRIEERSASIPPLVCRYREKITDPQRALVAQAILCSIDELKQTGEWFRRCQESDMIDRKAGEKFRSVAKKTE